VNHRDEKGNAEQLMKDFLHVLRGQFYGDDEPRFYAHKNMLMQAIAWPARVMVELGVWLPDKRLREILGEIIKGIKQKGNTGAVKHFGAYFLHSVQAHMKIRQDHYYQEGKTARSQPVDRLPFQEMLKSATVADQAEETPAQTCERLVQIAEAFKPKRRKKQVASQQTLF
jgi:hypothetical protein